MLGSAARAEDRPVVQRPFEWSFLWKDNPEDGVKRRGLRPTEIADVLRKDLGDGHRAGSGTASFEGYSSAWP
ncbi:hypothetical protein AK812_SmicGene25062 [Symbiodinium microadriaticum]|uniref:Uncharacterized protein n=1 Tax=Symbiodinium microadriaticum TaxID=2951 RepID=A0A1Q9DD27_SYMMI|nr:hypothetical protein AK812_SmicGene25062 [Symbiodinium microadriaticum]